jgi:hypothetical protein
MGGRVGKAVALALDLNDQDGERCVMVDTEKTGAFDHPLFRATKKYVVEQLAPHAEF